MKPLHVQVAEALGWTRTKDCSLVPDTCYGAGEVDGVFAGCVPMYDTDIGKAFQVVEKVRNKPDADGRCRWYFRLADFAALEGQDHWTAQLFYRSDDRESDKHCEGVGKTVAEAICKAALCALSGAARVALFAFMAGQAQAADVSLLAGPLSSAGLGEQRLSGAIAVEVYSGPFEVSLRYDSARKVESGEGWIGTAAGSVAFGPARLGGAFVHRDGGLWTKDTFWLEPGAQVGAVTVTLRAAVAGQTEREYGARARVDLGRRVGGEVQVLRHHDGQLGKTAFLFLRIGR